MKNVLRVISLIAFCCIFWEVAAQNEDRFILEKKINLHVQDQPLSDVLSKVLALANINFSYDPSIFNSEELVSGDYENIELEQVLLDILGDQYQFQVLENQLIITLVRDKVSIPDSPSSDIFIISGTITDVNTQKPLPYASISIHEIPFGTIANRDGQYELKIPKIYLDSMLVFSSMGYTQEFVFLNTLTDNQMNVEMKPAIIRLGEVVVTAIDPVVLLDNVVDRIPDNYPQDNRLMTSFYREVLLQDDHYISVSEAIMEILKASYSNQFREDRVSILKGRKSPDVETFKYVDFKMQGGPFYITKLDVVKTMYSFLDKTNRAYYKYEADFMIDYSGRPTYVILFEPKGKADFTRFEGRLYIDKETLALVHAEFGLGKEGIKSTRENLVKKKPKGFNVKPQKLDYQVTYKLNGGRWYLGSAQISVDFRVKSKSDDINSVFHSVSDLLITNHEKTNLRRFLRDDMFVSTDIFTEMIIDYDKEFWGNFNVIKPNEDLREAIHEINNIITK